MVTIDCYVHVHVHVIISIIQGMKISPMRVVGEKGKLWYLDGPKVQSRSSFLLYYGHKILMANMYDKLLTMYIFLIACINKKDHI